MEAAMGIFGCLVVWFGLFLIKKFLALGKIPAKERQEEIEPPDIQRKTLELLLLP